MMKRVFPLMIAIYSLVLTSCLNSTPDFDSSRILDEQGTNKDHIKPAEIEQTKKIIVGKDLASKKLCQFVNQLPENKSTKQTNMVVDSILALFLNNTDLDVNCGCSNETTVRKFGANLPIIKHFFRNKYKKGQDYKFLPIHMASLLGSDTVVNIFLKKGAFLDVKDSGKNLPLELAIKILKPRTIQKMIESGADPSGICLCGIDDLSKIKKLTSIGIDSSGVDVSGGLGTFLEDENLNDYLAYNPDINKCPLDLFFASSRNDKTLKKLIKHGLKPFTLSKRGNNESVLSKFVKKSDIKDETIVLLLNNISDSNLYKLNEPYNDPFFNKYLLHEAVQNGQIKTVAKMIELGADPEIIDEDRKNAKSFAEGNQKMQELLSKQ